MNAQVDPQLDESALARAELREITSEYEATEGGQAPPLTQGAGGMPPSEPPRPPMDWKIPAGLIVGVLDRMVVPNWSLEPAEKEMLHEQLELTLEVLFPSVALDPRIVALLSLGGTVMAIVARRLDMETGRLKPLHAPPLKQDDGQVTAA